MTTALHITSTVEFEPRIAHSQSPIRATLAANASRPTETGAVNASWKFSGWLDRLPTSPYRASTHSARVRCVVSGLSAGVWVWAVLAFMTPVDALRLLPSRR
jgi:hypothetical protein